VFLENLGDNRSSGNFRNYGILGTGSYKNFGNFENFRIFRSNEAFGGITFKIFETFVISFFRSLNTAE
jgi:hypothetical protein